MDIENRVKYYMGKWYYTKIEIGNPQQYAIGTERLNDRIILLNQETLTTIPKICGYSNYLVQNANVFRDNHFLYTMGDCIHRKKDLPILCKVTTLTDHHIIVKLNNNRHWRHVPTVKEDDIDFRKKKNSIVWRGASTGFNKRNPIIEQWHSHLTFNIGFSTLIHGRVSKYPAKGALSRKEQLEYKFILVIEGNDVSSGLKWQLYSNSVVIMAKPTCISWAMEDKLLPYIHYIPVKSDYSDLEEVFNWALKHQADCIKISKNAKAFIEPFLDEEKEQEIHRRIIKRYIQNVTIKNPST